ncbi:MAG: glycoside hydrolase family 5 protein [Fidelibacterota bacterium]|nr:MAG: glycoside hydrolase family 5 protein [Candidatus Neomarinimicrobiota bacterium]
MVCALPFILSFWGCASLSDNQTTEDYTPTVEDSLTFQQNEHLGRGVNLGNALEAPAEGDWGVTLQAEYFQLIKDAGFNAVRIPIRWSAHASSSAPYTIDSAFFDRVDWAVGHAFTTGLLAVINMHHYDGIAEDPSTHKERFLSMWEQIAFHYQDYSDSLLFEVLNEPHDQLTPNLWNGLLQDALNVIRNTNPVRTVVIGTAEWGHVQSLKELVIPVEDRNIIVTVHYYNPFHFTHQGAEWVSGSDAWMGTTWTGTTEEEQAVIDDFDEAANWAQKYHRPIFLGEFGAYSKADINSRTRWTDFVARQAEERDMSWAYWEFCAGFGVYNQGTSDWNYPILKALIP